MHHARTGWARAFPAGDEQPSAAKRATPTHCPSSPQRMRAPELRFATALESPLACSGLAPCRPQGEVVPSVAEERSRTLRSVALQETAHGALQAHTNLGSNADAARPAEHTLASLQAEVAARARHRPG